MKERPILMQAAMGQAAHEGRKTITRRPIKPQPAAYVTSIMPFGDEFKLLTDFPNLPGRVSLVRGEIKCPYGAPGDELWVKETHFLFGMWVKNGLTKTGRQAWRFKPSQDKGAMFPENPPPTICAKKSDVGWFKRNSLFMPRWASRTEWIVKSVTAERVQEITEQEAEREGFEAEWGNNSNSAHYAYECFIDLWDAMYHGQPALAFDADPWVWRVEFERKEQP